MSKAVENVVINSLLPSDCFAPGKLVHLLLLAFVCMVFMRIPFKYL